MALNDIGTDTNVLNIDIVDIRIKKYANTESMSVLPQFYELSIFQSIINPVMKCELLLNDTISLHVNFPLVGEETVEITIKPTVIDPSDSSYPSDQTDRHAQDNQTFTLKFMVSDVREIVPDDKSRSSIYAFEMYSLEMYYNAKYRVQRAFKDQYHNVAQTILKDYLNTDSKRINTANFEESKEAIPFIIPNMKPLESIVWLAKRAVPTDTKHNLYLFYEDFYGFNFKTVQKLMEMQNEYNLYYISNITPEVRQTLQQEKALDHHMVTALQLPKRYSTIEKFITGFYENEYYEVDVFNKRVNNKQTEAPLKPVVSVANNQSQLNTQNYLRDAKINNSNPGTKTRVRYAIGQNGGDDPEYPNYFSDKFGEAVRAQSALSQISITVAAPGDTRVQAGNIVDLSIPEFHGFNIVEEDYYIAGRYLVTDVKHTISVGMKHVMALNLVRDSYKHDIEPKSRFTQGTFNPDGR